MRKLDRSPHSLRKIKITPNYIVHAEGSVLVEFGDTKVICTASVDTGVPPFLKNTGKGWVTAEYGMLPRSTNTRIKREKAANSGRTHEIQRLIGRSLRAAVSMDMLGERQIFVDCDVIQADGGTRTASITGGYVALGLCLQGMLKRNEILTFPLKNYVAAVSCGIVDGEVRVDLDYDEDSKAEVDMNFVMTTDGKFVEIQGTAESKPFSEDQMTAMTAAARKAIEELFEVQNSHMPFFPRPK